MTASPSRPDAAAHRRLHLVSDPAFAVASTAEAVGLEVGIGEPRVLRLRVARGLGVVLVALWFFGPYVGVDRGITVSLIVALAGFGTGAAIARPRGMDVSKQRTVFRYIVAVCNPLLLVAVAAAVAAPEAERVAVLRSAAATFSMLLTPLSPSTGLVDLDASGRSSDVFDLAGLTHAWSFAGLVGYVLMAIAVAAVFQRLLGSRVQKMRAAVVWLSVAFIIIGTSDAVQVHVPQLSPTAVGNAVYFTAGVAAASFSAGPKDALRGVGRVACAAVSVVLIAALAFVESWGVYVERTHLVLLMCLLFATLLALLVEPGNVLGRMFAFWPIEAAGKIAPFCLLVAPGTHHWLGEVFPAAPGWAVALLSVAVVGGVSTVLDRLSFPRSRARFVTSSVSAAVFLVALTLIVTACWVSHSFRGL